MTEAAEEENEGKAEGEAERRESEEKSGSIKREAAAQE